ncbi:PspC domain-containing protein [Streptomyces rimosus]|uniref:PspC domain-containing protein n=1 Tax=Streptomyces rimosus TaxID=1927 RepID=UPI0007C52695|nr:PspC domain-containing protein [Streptomyces rimosus]
MNDAAPADNTTGPAGDASGPTGTPPAPDATRPAPQTHPRRSRRHKVIAGVCGGLGRHWDLDPVIFRIVLAVLAASGGIGLIVYGFAWLLIPQEGEDENEGRRLLSGRVEGTALTALLFALVGCGFFLTSLANRGVLAFTVMLALAVGGSAYWSRQRRTAGPDGPGAMDPATAQAVADAPPETMAPPTRNGPSWWRDPLSKEGTAGVGYLWGPDGASHGASYGSSYGASYGHEQAYGDKAGAGGRPSGATAWGGPGGPRTGVPAKRRRAGRPIGGWTFLLAVIAAMAAGGAAAEHHQPSTVLVAGLSAALVVFGLGLVISAWWGRTGGGTVFMVILTSLLLAGAAVLPPNVTTDWHNRVWAPMDAASVRESYDIGAGRGELDLSNIPFKNGQTVRTRASVGAGQLQVTMPEGVTARLRIDVGLGDVRLPGETSKDFDLTADQEQTITLPATGLKDGEKPHGTLDLDLKVGAGQVSVERKAPTGASASATPSPSPSASASAGDAPAAADTPEAAAVPAGASVPAAADAPAVPTAASPAVPSRGEHQ